MTNRETRSPFKLAVMPVLNTLFAKKIPGTCRIRLMEHMCEDLGRFSAEMSKIFGLGEEGSGVMGV
jgi:hypothetical protein